MAADARVGWRMRRIRSECPKAVGRLQGAAARNQACSASNQRCSVINLRDCWGGLDNDPH